MKIGLIAAVSVASIIALYRVFKGDKLIFAFAGVLGVALAGGYAYFVGNAKSYFLPKILVNGVSIIILLVTIILKKPFIAYVSHISRGWPLKWFWRKDVRPAYTEVSFGWIIIFTIRLVILLSLYNNGEVSQLVWVNFILGTPTTVLGLILTYLYGSARLKRLQGPSIEEFNENKQPPFEGQIRGF